MTSLYEISEEGLEPVPRSTLADEAMLEGWIAKDPAMIGLDVLVIGQQVMTDHKGKIDILAIDRGGDLCIVELKRDKTPRDVVAQVLDYASWVSGLSTKRVHEIAMDTFKCRLEEKFREHFGTSLPENLNANHSMVIVASEFDASSRRIVEYLAEEHDLSINTAFFTVFEQGGKQLLATEWLMDQQEVVERAESKKKAPWTGYWYVNAGSFPGYRSWEDMMEYGFVSAGGTPKHAKPLERLRIDDPVYAYHREKGYVGFGIVTAQSVPAKDFRTSAGRALCEVDLVCPKMLDRNDDPERSEYVVAVDWKKAVPVEEARRFPNSFYYRKMVCRLMHQKQRHRETLEFLAEEFGTV